MICNFKRKYLIVLTYLYISIVCALTDLTEEELSRAEGAAGEQGAAGDAGLLPYVAAVLKMTNYLSAGALVKEDWVLTAADGLYLVRESVRLLRVRLGSVNYKRGGSLVPVKYFRIHPYFDDCRPEYDVALLRVSRRAQPGPGVRPVALQRRLAAVSAAHFLVTAWAPHGTKSITNSEMNRESTEALTRTRMLSAKQTHPTDEQHCRRQQEYLGFKSTPNIMCLETFSESDPCVADAGAPVVLNGVLWGIVSSWRPDNCNTDSWPSFVNLVAAPNISSWMETVTGDLHWKLMETRGNEDNFI